MNAKIVLPPAPLDENKTADELIPGRSKRAQSYSSEYGGKTYGEIKELAKQGDQKAKKMKKLIEETPHLSQKPPKRR